MRVSKGLPALMRAQEQQTLTAKVGFDWSDCQGVFEKVEEEVSEVKRSYENGDNEKIAEEIGGLLFACVNLARHLGVDAEELPFQALSINLGKGSGRLSHIWSRKA